MMTWKKYHLKQEDDLKNVDTQEYEDDITYSNQLSEMEKIGSGGRLSFSQWTCELSSKEMDCLTGNFTKVLTNLTYLYHL